MCVNTYNKIDEDYKHFFLLKKGGYLTFCTKFIFEIKTVLNSPWYVNNKAIC